MRIYSPKVWRLLVRPRCNFALLLRHFDKANTQPTIYLRLVELSRPTTSASKSSDGKEQKDSPSKGNEQEGRKSKKQNTAPTPHPLSSIYIYMNQKSRSTTSLDTVTERLSHSAGPRYNFIVSSIKLSPLSLTSIHPLRVLSPRSLHQRGC